MAEIPGAADVSPEWLTAQLRAAGVICHESVTDFTARPIGNGLVGDSLRYALTYDPPAPRAPASLVAKFPAGDAVSRAAGAGMRLYQREVNFYRYIAPTVRIHTPRVYAAHFDPATHDFVLLLEDMAPARAGDQLAGCAPDDAALAMAEIAGLHAPYWGAASLDAMDWLSLPHEDMERIAQLVAPVTGMFLERYRPVLEDEVVEAVSRVPPLAHRILFDVPAVRTVIHGDFRLDNVLFDAKGGARPFVTLDWQTVGRGCGTLDASYFLGAGLLAPDRAAHERALLRIYHDTLVRDGVRGYDFETCWDDYRKHSVNGVFMAVFSAISVARTERGDAMFLAMARRHAAQALELGGFDLWA